MSCKYFTALIPCLLGGAVMAQTLPTGKRLSDNGVLIGATAEVGAADKEGLFSWGGAAKVDTVMRREFGLVQTTSYPTWDTWSGTDLKSVAFNMSKANRVINRAKEMGKKTAVHLLAGSPTYFPNWLNSGSHTPAELDTLLNRWITFAVTANNNSDKVDYWNVVNEAFMWNGKYWDSSSAANTCPWQRMGWETDKSGLTGSSQVYTQHPVYIRRAFEMARKHTKAKLELRDYGIEFWDFSTKAKAFYQLVKHLKNSGTPIDAVGFQGHFRTDVNYIWPRLQEAVKQYRDLGLEVYITEVDFGDTDPIAAATTAHRSAAYDSLQAKGLYEFTKAAVAGGANWICMWGVADNANTYWRMGQSALLFDENYAAKNSYYRFRQGIVDGLLPTPLQTPQGESNSFRQAKRYPARLALGKGHEYTQMRDVQGRRFTGASLSRKPEAIQFLVHPN